LVWFGESTERWWALVAAAPGWRLIEAGDPCDLAVALREALSCRWPSGQFLRK
jgi:hypothetical protein